jgi:hypothetical protein
LDWSTAAVWCPGIFSKIQVVAEERIQPEETKMKQLLAHLLYFLGDLISRLFYWDLFSFMYPVYNRIMLWSSDLDQKGEIWKKPDME